MAWIATLISVNKVGGNVIPTVQFSQDGEIITQDFRSNNITLAALSLYVQQVIDQLTVRDVAAANLASLVGLPVAAPLADPAAQAATDFFTKRAQLNALQKAIDMGLSTDTVTRDNLKSAVATAFKPEYLQDMRF